MSGGMLVPRLLFLVAIGAMLIPVIKEYAVLEGKSPAGQPLGAAWDLWRAIVAAVENRQWDFLIPGVLLVAVTGLIASYATLSELLVTRLGAIAAFIPTVALAAAALASVGAALYPPDWEVPEARNPAASAAGKQQRTHQRKLDEKVKP